MYYTTSSGRLTLTLTRAQAAQGSHPGACDADVAALRRVPAIRWQLAKIDAGTLRAELAEYGAWDDAELSDHDANLNRILWLACGYIDEECRHRASAPARGSKDATP